MQFKSTINYILQNDYKSLIHTSLEQFQQKLNIFIFYTFVEGRISCGAFVLDCISFI